MTPIKIEVGRDVKSSPAAATPRVAQVAAMFGIGMDQSQTRTIVPGMALELRGGQIVFITGASGGGKTTLLRCIEEALAPHAGAGRVRVLKVGELANTTLLENTKPFLDTSSSERALVDQFALDLKDTLEILSLAGLGDAFVMLRRPGELSDGQRRRYEWALALADTLQPSRDREGAEGVKADEPALRVLIADEFGATLDRATARILARNLRRWIDGAQRQGHPVCAILATTHDDLLEALAPDTLIEKPPGGGATLATRGVDGRMEIIESRAAAAT